MIPKVGEEFRQYRVTAKAGQGGMGVVFRAHDTKLGRDVALKFLTGVGALDAVHTERLRAEARTLAALNHPNIVTIYDLDEHDGDPYLVLEWVDGWSVRRASMITPWDEEGFLGIVVQVADALAAAHAAGVVHRDLKSENVLLAGDGAIKLVDFGIAQLRDGASLTLTGETVGTPSAMAPEQLTGGTVGPAADVFAFGVLAYWMLSLHHPFTGDQAAARMYATVHEPPVPLGTHRTDLSAAVVSLIDRCLAKKPEHRFADGAALARELRGIIRNRTARMPVPAPPEHGPEIRYARTADGASIAYAVHGNGPVLVRVLGWFTHLDQEWEWPEMREIWERLGRTHTVVRYDGRGMGLSGPWSGEFDAETRRLDLEAVLDAVGSPKVVLYGISEGGWTAAHYAATHPERVERLIVYGGYVHGASSFLDFDQDEAKALLTLVRKGWGRDTPEIRQIFATKYFGTNADPTRVDYFNRLQRASADPDTAVRYMWSNWVRGDGSDFYRTIRQPTLIVHARGDLIVNLSEARDMAALVPDAQFVTLPGSTHYFPVGDEVTDLMVAAIERFTANS